MTLTAMLFGNCPWPTWFLAGLPLSVGMQHFLDSLREIEEGGREVTSVLTVQKYSVFAYCCQ